jgi:hypothetical protein
LGINATIKASQVVVEDWVTAKVNVMSQAYPRL